MAPTPEQARVVAALKAGRSEQSAIPIKSEASSVVGRLRPVTRELAQDPDIINALHRWRMAHMEAFLTVFVSTPEKTRNYLSSFSLPDPARILFLIADRQDRFIGHSGLCNIAADGAEIDNVIRGEPTDIADFMVLAQRAVLRWAFANLYIPLAYLNVLAHNTRAIRSYEKTGFVEAGRTPLMRLDTDDGYRLVPASPDSDETHAAALLRMELSRDAFCAELARLSAKAD